MADVGQTGLSGEQSRRCLVFKFDLMSYIKKTVNDLISVNTRIDQPMKHDIMFHGLINPCIHLIESHHVY